MNLWITPGKLRGTVTPPPSKSQAHRLLIAAALTDGESRISNLSFSQDIEATIRCMESLGAQLSRSGSDWTVRGLFAGGKRPEFRELPFLDCGESGSTLRFLIPVALAVADGGVFTGRGRLMERPQKPYFDLFAEKNIFYEQRDGLLTVRGKLEPGRYDLPGNVSSQFFTGLLFALPLLDGPSQIVSTTPLESAGYLSMTLDALGGAGLTAVERRDLSDGRQAFCISGPRRCAPFQRTVEADWSQAAFFYAAGGIGNDVRLAGMNPASCQGDCIIADWAQRLRGAENLTLDVSGNPDLVPPLAIWAALREGCTTRIVGAARLRIKESDRLETVTSELRKLGACVEQEEDRLTFCGAASLHGGTVDSHNDHRIAMMLSVAATRADGEVRLLDAGSVAKSYPDFWSVYAALGGKIREDTG